MTSSSGGERFKAEYAGRVDLPRRVVYLRMTGIFSIEQIKSVGELVLEMSRLFKGKKHMVLADMRGLKTLRPEAAKLMGDFIRRQRTIGVVLCAHLSDDSVLRLQTRRVARENSPHDELTVDVASVEEAERVLDEARSRIDDDAPLASIRA